MRDIADAFGLVVECGVSIWLTFYFWLWLLGINGEPSGRMQTAVLLIAASYALNAHLLLRVRDIKEGR